MREALGAARRGERRRPRCCASFEKRMLAELGYAPLLERDAASGAPIDPAARYVYEPERGPMLSKNAAANDASVSGQTLLDLAADDYDRARRATRRARLMRALIAQRLHGQVLHTRAVLRGPAATCDRARRQRRPRRDRAPGAAHLRARPGVGRGRGAPGRRRRHHRAPARGPAPHPGRGRAPAARAHAHQAQPGDGGDRRDGRHRRRHQARDGDAGARRAARSHHRGRPRHRFAGKDVSKR